MAKINEQTFKTQIKKGEFSNVYILYGNENYLKSYYLEKLKKKLVNPAFADFNFHEYEGSQADINDIIMDAQTMPMMSEYSLIIVHDYPLAKNKADMKLLKEYFKEPSDSSVLVFWYETINIDPKDSSWKTVINAFSKAGDAVEINERTMPELVKLVISFAKRRGCTIDNSAARYLIEAVGNDIQTLTNELSKICEYAGEEKVINKKIIDDVAVRSLQARVFDLSKFILAGNSEKAYSSLFALFYQREDPLSILSIISGSYVDMYRVKCAKEAGKNARDVADYYQYNNRLFVLDNASRDGAKISIDTLRKAIDILANTDLLMKSSPVDNKILLEEAVAKLLVLKES